MKKDFFLNGFAAIAIVGMALSACTDNEPDYGSEVSSTFVVFPDAVTDDAITYSPLASVPEP